MNRRLRDSRAGDVTQFDESKSEKDCSERMMSGKRWSGS